MLSHNAKNANWNDAVWRMIEIMSIYKASFATPAKCIVQTEGGDNFVKGEMTSDSGIYVQIGDESKSPNELFAIKNNTPWPPPTKQQPKANVSTHGYCLAHDWDQTIDWYKTFPLVQVQNNCKLRMQRDPEFDYDYACDCGKAAKTESAIRAHVTTGNAPKLSCPICSFQAHRPECLASHIKTHNSGKRRLEEKIADIVAAGPRKLKKFN